jgi:hypothetical protein
MILLAFCVARFGERITTVFRSHSSTAANGFGKFLNISGGFMPRLRHSRFFSVNGLALQLLFVLPSLVLGQANHHAILPPELKWQGKSQALIVDKKDPWITPVEQSDFVHTPRYDETVQWLRKLVEAAAELEMVSLGKSPEGRDLWMVVASREQAFTPATLHATGKPVFLAQAGIHSGDIDG